MRKTILTAICLWLAVLTAWAQLARENVEQFIADTKDYERAVRSIVESNEYDEGIAILTTLIARCEGRDDYPAEELATFYNTRGHAQFKKKEYALAQADGDKALRLLAQAGEKGKKELTATWYQAALNYYYWGKGDEAMEAAGSCIAAALDYYGPDHTETMKAYDLRSNIAGFLGRNSVALADRQAIFESIHRNVGRNFAYLTASERTAYWNKHLPETTILFAFAHKMGEWQSAFTDALFCQQLLAKGLLLTAESRLQRAVDGDDRLRTAYQKIRRLRRQAADAKAEPAAAQAAMLEADREERSVGTSASTLYQFLDFLKVSTSDVKERLKASEAAVEFVDYRVGKDSTMYAALVLSPRWEHVRLIPLMEARELTACIGNGPVPVSGETLAKRLWQPIIDALGNGITTLYFSPSGKLYQLPLESLTLPGGRIAGQAYCLHRLSSTRWLALPDEIAGGSPATERSEAFPTTGSTDGSPANTHADAVVYGGLTYDASIDEMAADAQHYATRSDRSAASGIQRGAGAAMGLPYLPETKTEAEAIAAIINGSGQSALRAQLLTGTSGTEASVKSLDGQRRRVLHVATHGFYSSAATTGDALAASGLFFAGADNARQGEQLPQGIDDGILTAAEIATLDLRGLDMAVLSACQTGDGQVTADGVFGLQRGFKKAGAQSILMSLWKVNDAATCMLMTEFYRNWIVGHQSKRDALEAAKQTVRSHKENKWDDPQFWAAFILLDALD